MHVALNGGNVATDLKLGDSETVIRTCVLAGAAKQSTPSETRPGGQVLLNKQRTKQSRVANAACKCATDLHGGHTGRNCRRMHVVSTREQTDTNFMPQGCTLFTVET
jgi:hypothetical protein